MLADLSDPSRSRIDWSRWHGAGGRSIFGSTTQAPTCLQVNAADWSFEEKLAALWKVDVVATLRLSRAIGKRMRERGHGVILNIGWDQAETGMAGDSGEIFAAVKGAVMAATRSLAKTLAPEVRVNCIAPGGFEPIGVIKRPMNGRNVRSANRCSARWGEPEDVARVACFLVSPAASSSTVKLFRSTADAQIETALSGPDQCINRTCMRSTSILSRADSPSTRCEKPSSRSPVKLDLRIRST